VYNAREITAMGVDPTRNNTHGAMYLRNPNGLVRTNDLDYLPPSSDGLYAGHSLLAMKFRLKTQKPSGEAGDAAVFIERFTADDLALYEYTLDQTVKVQGRHVRRPPCVNGPAQDGRQGCQLYRVPGGRDSHLDGTLGVFLFKLEAQRFLETGELPLACENRRCILCELELYQCEVGLNNMHGHGQRADELGVLAVIQKFQVPVGVIEGYDIQHCMTDTPTLAPILAFRPYLLCIIETARGERRVCDDKMRWQPSSPSPAAFRSGATC
jgi:hypothetical protein